MMRKMNLLKTVVALFVAAAFTGCSLLKVAVSTGEPLSKQEMRMRTLTRGFYYDMTTEVGRAADSIAVQAKTPAMRIAAVKWKIRSSKAGVAAVMQGIPDVAMADMWILCRRMNDAFAAAPDSLLFGTLSPLARETAARLDTRAARLARQLLPEDRYGLMKEFVEEYVRENPAGENANDNTTLAWIEFLRENGVEHAYATGSIAEVLADINDRVSGQTQQISNSVGWSAEIIRMQLQQDSVQGRLMAQVDSLGRNFDRMVVVAENLPGISEKVLADLNRQATQLIWTVNAAAETAFADLDRQRGELQLYVSQERQALVEQLRGAGDEMIRTAMDTLPGFVGRILFYVVVGLLVLLGAPFALGFWLGGIRERARRKKQEPEK